MTPRLLALLALSSIGCAHSSGAKTADEAWWLLEDLGDEDGDGEDDGDDDDDDDDGDDDDDEALPPGATFWGELVVDGDRVDDGNVGVVISDEEGEMLCEVEYEIAGSAAASDCTACSFAVQLTIGAPLFEEDENGQCAAGGYLDWQGQTRELGQGNGALMMEVDGSWVEVGWSEREGSEWFFQASLAE